jgi:hypothetical protein
VTRGSSRLHTLLKVRRIQEEIRRGRLAGEVVAERRAEQELQQAYDRYALPAAEPLAALDTTKAFLGERRHKGALAGSVRAASAGADTAAEVTLYARAEWSEAAMRMTALERLADRAREAARTERLAAEQRTSDESASALRQRRPGRVTQRGRS